MISGVNSNYGDFNIRGAAFGATTRRSAEGDGLPQDGLAGSVESRLPGKPSFAASTSSTTGANEGHRKSTIAAKAVTWFVAACMIGTLGLGIATSAEAAPPKERPAATQVVQQKDTAYQVGAQLNQVGREVGREAVKQGKEVARQAQEVAGQAREVGQQLNEATKPIQEVGKEIGKTGAQVGKEIGKAGKEVGLEVAKQVTSFWKGLAGN